MQSVVPMIRVLALLLLVVLAACSTGKAVQSDFSGMVRSLGMPALARQLSPNPNGGVNTYDPATGSNL